MPWSGGVFTQTNGVYTGATIWNSDKNAGTLITSAHHDTHDYDMAQGINACVLKDGTNTMTILNLSGTVNATSGIINVGSLNVVSTYGTGNAFLGGAGIVSLTTGSAQQNTGIGFDTLNALTTGLGNTAVGWKALFSCSTGATNTAVGLQSLTALTTGTNNAALGYGSLIGCTTGTVNVGIGFNSLPSVTTGANNVGIGHSADVPDGTGNGQLSLQNALYGIANTGTSSTLSTGNLGVYVKAPTARLHLIASTAAAGTASLKIDPGTLLGTPENGAIEFDGTHLYVTIGGVRKTVTVT